VYAKVVKSETPVEKASQKHHELKCHKLFVVSASEPILPFQMEDATRQEPKEEQKKDDKKDDQVIRVGQEIRLDNRWIDLRTPANHAIFRLQSRVGQYYRQFFIDRDFVEIHSPKIIPGVSEGGSQVFRLSYFGTPCCLAQSPQLYKQMGVTSDLFRVFEIGPVFRAEDSNTHRHMCEFMGLDFEMEIKEGYWEVTKMLGDLFAFIFENITKHCQAELSAVNGQYPFEPLKYLPETLILSHNQAVNLLKEDGVAIGQFDDFSTPQEKQLGRIVRAKYNTDFYIVDKYPLTARPFYTMPCPNDPKYTNSYDAFIRGEEITSGAQRIHDVDLLKKRATECNIPFSNIEKYLESFKFGAYPHGGAGIGLERVVMLYLGLNNIRKSTMFPRTPDRLTP